MTTKQRSDLFRKAKRKQNTMGVRLDDEQERKFARTARKCGSDEPSAWLRTMGEGLCDNLDLLDLLLARLSGHPEVPRVNGEPAPARPSGTSDGESIAIRAES